MSRAPIKPLVHWAISKGYTLRISERDAARVAGTVTTPAGARPFTYDPLNRIITLGGVSAPITIAINEYGWEENAA